MPRVAHVGSGYGKTQPSPTMKMRSQLMKPPPCRSPALKTLPALAGAYEARAHAKAAVTPTLQAKADELTTGITAPYDQAKTLYTWVARNIRYAGNCIGVGSVVPHDAEMVLSNRLGDCKDHTALLQALLAAKGIDSMPVLVNSGDRYKLPEPTGCRIL